MINNTEFDARLGLSDRSGSDVDASSLFQRFMELGFESDLMNDASRDDLVEKLQESKNEFAIICISCCKNFLLFCV